MDLSRLLPYRSIITPIAGVVAGLAFLAMLAPSPPPESPEPPVNRENRPNISSFRLPDKLDFAGEPVPLEDPEVRKRMDREFLLNLQWDGQVMLYLKRSGEYFEMYDRILKE